MLCGVAALRPAAVPPEHLLDVAARLRDKRVGVRREVLRQLATVYKAQFDEDDAGARPSSSDGGGSGGGASRAWIPGKLLRLCIDPDIRHHTVEPILDEELFPARLSAEEHAEQWMRACAAMDARELQCFEWWLRKKAQFQQELRAYLQARAALRAAQAAKGKAKPAAAELDALSARCERACKALASHFPEPAKAAASLDKVHALKDGHVFRGLERAADLDATVAEARAAREDVLQRLGAEKKSGVHDLVHHALVKASTAAFNKQHVAAALALLARCTHSGAGAPSKPEAKLLVRTPQAAVAPRHSAAPRSASDRKSVV